MTDSLIVPVLICGGAGTRLWPLSRESLPKPFIAIEGAHTPFQRTALRYSDADLFAPPLVVANAQHSFIVAEQMREMAIDYSCLIAEPVSRNTAPAAALAALSAVELDADAVILIAPTDHIVEDEESLCNAIRAGLHVARSGRIVLFGTEPLSRSSGYGYIRRADEIMHGVFNVTEFIEKPGEELAEELLATQSYSWNCGLCLVKAQRLIDEFEQLAPDVVKAARAALGNGARDPAVVRLSPDHFNSCPVISLDHAILEKTDRLAVVPVSCGWADLGAWSSLCGVGVPDADANVVLGDVVVNDARNCYLRGKGRLVAATGVDDLIVVATDDVVLVTRKGKDHNVKELVERLKDANRSAATSSNRVHRPWGYYECIEHGDRYQVKRITVRPGGKLSLQMHFHRAEHWVVVNGTALVTRDDEKILLRENESIYLPLGTVHRLENPGKLPLNLIEVQSGAYLGEDDIVRIDDIYQRV